jgi:hypothetical protein
MERTPTSPTPYSAHLVSKSWKLATELRYCGCRWWSTFAIVGVSSTVVHSRRWLDSALGAAVISSIDHEEWCGTLQLSVQYNDPARRGPLVGVGRVVRRGRHVAFAEGEVTDGEGQIVARAHGTWVIWRGHPDG